MGIAVSLAAGALALSAASTVVSVAESRRAARFRNKAAKITAKRNALESRRARLRTIEEFRIANGLVVNSGAQSGAQGSSGFAALQSSLSQQLSSNLNFNSQIESFNRQQGRFLSKANSAQSLAADFGAIASFASQFAVAKSKAKSPKG